MKKRFNLWQRSSPRLRRAAGNLLTFLPIALLSIALVSIGAASAGPLTFQSPEEQPQLVQPTKQQAQPTPEPPKQQAQPTPEPPKQQAQPTPEPTQPPPTEQPQAAQPQAAQSPLTQPQQDQSPVAAPTKTPKAKSGGVKGPEPTDAESSEPEFEGEEESSDGEGLNWDAFLGTSALTAAYIWLCCGGLAMLIFPVVLGAAYFVGRKKLASSSGNDKV